jgi:hypothetical protein
MMRRTVSQFFTIGVLLAFSLLPVALGSPAASAAEPVHGTVVDRDGQGIDKADVRFYGNDKREVGHARTDSQGRFSAAVSAPPETWTVEAKNYQTRTMRFLEIGSSAVVLYTRTAKAPGKLDGADFAVLPYQDVGYVFSLAPFTAIQGGGSIAVGDRGLSGSANALQGGTSFDQVPAHYLSFAGIADASRAFKYSDGAAGHYTLGFDRAAGAAMQAGFGSLRIAGLQGRAGDAAFGYGASTGDLTEHSRVDAVTRSKLGAGKLLFAAGRSFVTDLTGSEEALGNETTSQLRVDEPWLGDTATFEVKAKTKTKTKLADYSENDSEVSGEFRLRGNGALFGTEAGIKITRDTGVRNYTTKIYTGSTVTDDIFASETYSGSRLTVNASLAWYGLHDAGATHKVPQGIAQSASGLAPSLRVRWQLSDRFALEGTRASVEDSPSVSDQFFADPVPGLVLDRSNLTEGSLLYNSPGGFNAEITSYSERYTTAFPTTQLSGFGAAIDWPVARDWRLRAWTLNLHDIMPGVKRKDLGPSSGRDVAWLTYYGGRTTRFDVIYRRETDPVEFGRYVDADAALAVGPHLWLIGTMEHHALTSSYGLTLSFEDRK